MRVTRGLLFLKPFIFVANGLLDESGEDEGMLPLLQYALKESWALRKGNCITGDSYAHSGGVREAIRMTASPPIWAYPVNALGPSTRIVGVPSQSANETVTIQSPLITPSHSGDSLATAAA